MSIPPLVDLLPHKPPMTLLDEVLERKGERVVCRAIVREGAPFVKEGRVAAVVMLEYMAQSAAAFAGLEALGRGEPIRVGFLVACREMLLFRDFVPTGVALCIEAKRIWGDLHFGHFECQVTEDGETVATASLSVAREAAIP